MTKDILRIAGEIAGIGGLLLGIFLLLFKGVIRKRVFPSLTKVQSGRLYRSLLMLPWAIAFVGISCWIFSQVLAHDLNSTAVSSDSLPIVFLDRDFPIAFENSRDKAREVLGAPQEITDAWDGYSSDGLKIYYSMQSGLVDGICLMRRPSGTAFPDTVLGIKVGDSLERVKHVLGKPAEWGRLNSNVSLAVWNHNSNFLIVVFLRDNNAMRSNAAQIDTVFGITYCREWSGARYESIIVKSIEEIRRGQRPSLLEDGVDSYLPKDGAKPLIMDLSDPCFQKPYEISTLQRFPYGGIYGIVNFHESKSVYFWIYPLMSVNPRIRSIRELDADRQPLRKSEEKPNNSDASTGK